MIKTQEEILSKVVDWILASDFATETVKDTKVGRDEEYFSVHSRNLDIIYQFPLEKDFIDAHPELKEALQKEFEYYLTYHIAGDSDAFDAWLYGGRIAISDKGYDDTFHEELDIVYRKRITETYQCDQCGMEISEKHTYYHPQSLHRVGHSTKENPERYEWKIYCKKCYDERLGVRRKTHADASSVTPTTV